MGNEGDAAQQSVASGAPKKAEQGEETLFDKIVAKKIPATILYEDETALAFKDINPQAPVHFLVIPKNRDGLTQLSKSTDRHEPLLGHLIHVASKVARQEGCDQGFRTVINDGPQGCQSVYHLHVHVFGGKQLGWPPC
ncbi:14 kDa zinc-binding protein [Trebouxia sp. C0009 RCD-2024]